VPAETPAESVFIMPVCCCTGPAPTGRRTGSVRALSSAIARPGGSRWSTSRWPPRIFAPAGGTRFACRPRNELV